MSQSVWPYDHAREPRLAAKVRLAQEEMGNLECFIICPSRPKEYFDDLIALLRNICVQISQGLNIKLSCNRAIDITSSGLIQPEIWQQIRAADFILADLTGLNGNVLYELGAAAAWHPKERVIVIRERPPEGASGGADGKPEIWLSDIQPVRHLQYVRTQSGLAKLAQELSQVFSEMIVAAPFEGFDDLTVQLPLNLDLSAGHDPEMLLGPGFAHRRALPGRFLEFGSLHAFGFPHSWLTVGNLKLRKVRVKARLLFSKLGHPEQDQPWLGVMLRSQTFWANHGHLAYIRANGSTWVTVEKETGHDDEQIGSIDGFDPETAEFDIETSIDDSAWRVQIGPVKWERAIGELPHVFGSGRIIIRSRCAWLALKHLTVEEID
jgi:hypothetical protein